MPYVSEENMTDITMVKFTNLKWEKIIPEDELFGSGTQWGFTDLNHSAGVPTATAAGDPSAYIFGNQVVVYRVIDGHIHLLFLR